MKVKTNTALFAIPWVLVIAYTITAFMLWPIANNMNISFFVTWFIASVWYIVGINTTYIIGRKTGSVKMDNVGIHILLTSIPVFIIAMFYNF